MFMPWKFALTGLLILTAIAAVSDARSGRIPNWLTLPFLVASPFAHWLTSDRFGVLFSVFGALSCAAVPYLMFRLGGMQGGDVKLLAGVGATAGAVMGLEVQIAAYLLTTLWALSSAALQRNLGVFARDSLRYATHALRRQAPSHGTELRFAPMVFAATLLVLSIHAAQGTAP